MNRRLLLLPRSSTEIRIIYSEDTGQMCNVRWYIQLLIAITEENNNNNNNSTQWRKTNKVQNEATAKIFKLKTYIAVIN